MINSGFSGVSNNYANMYSEDLKTTRVDKPSDISEKILFQKTKIWHL